MTDAYGNLYRHNIKAMILMNNDLPVTAENISFLNELWNMQGTYCPDKVETVINIMRSKHERSSV